MTRLLALIGAALAALVVAATAAGAPFQRVIALPSGFEPEGIAVGKRNAFYVGSIATGAIYRGNLRTGAGTVLPPAEPGRIAAGITVDDPNRLFVSGARTGQGYVYDARTGASLAQYDLGPAGTSFINDVALTKDAAWFTDSLGAVLYRVSVARNGALGDQEDVEEVPLAGDFELATGFNLNGIDATPNGKTLVAVQTNLGRLYRIDAATGEAELIDLGGGNVMFGDGILLDGRTLYVVQNQLDRVAVVRLSPDLRAGTIVGYLTDPELDVPTTIAEHGKRLYAVNARFGTPQPERASYSVVQLRK